MRLTPGEVVIRKGIFKVPLDAVPTQVECGVLKLTYKLKVVVFSRHYNFAYSC